MLLKEMKDVIKYAIELDIEYLETFLGYEGDKVLKVISKSGDVINKIGAYLENMGLTYKAEYNVDTQRHELFVGVEDPSVFKLKG